MVEAVVKEMVGAYPELNESAARVAKVIESEETRFANTVAVGLNKLEELISSAKATSPQFIEFFERHWPTEFTGLFFESVSKIRPNRAFSEEDRSALAGVIGSAAAGLVIEASSSIPQIKGADAFKLYDTFGLPLDFMVDAARDQGIQFDQAGFDAAMDEQRTTARASWKGGSQKTASPVFAALPYTIFEGYKQEQSANCEVVAIVVDGQGAQQLLAGQTG